MPVPIIAAGIGAATSIYGAHKAAGASKQAARTQSQAADKAMALQKQVYDNQTQLMAPWISGGQTAFTNMQRMAGGQQAMPYQPPTLGQAMQHGPQGPMPPPGPMPGGRVPLGQALEGGMAPMGGGAPMGGQDMAGGLVTLQMPDGTTQQMPRGAAQPMLMRGAQIVS